MNGPLGDPSTPVRVFTRKVWLAQGSGLQQFSEVPFSLQAPSVRPSSPTFRTEICHHSLHKALCSIWLDRHTSSCLACPDGRGASGLPRDKNFLEEDPLKNRQTKRSGTGISDRGNNMFQGQEVRQGSTDLRSPRAM